MCSKTMDIPIIPTHLVRTRPWPDRRWIPIESIDHSTLLQPHYVDFAVHVDECIFRIAFWQNTKIIDVTFDEWESKLAVCNVQCRELFLLHSVDRLIRLTSTYRISLLNRAYVLMGTNFVVKNYNKWGGRFHKMRTTRTAY